MDDFTIPDDPGAPPPETLPPYAPDMYAPPEHVDALPDPNTLTPYLRRQQVFGRFLDDAETVDGRIAVAMAAQARSVDELRQISVAIASEEAAEDATRPPELRANRGKEAGWSIENRAKVELTTEIASAFNLSKSAARNLIEQSQTLVEDLPLTLDALSTGMVRYEHARLIATTSWSLPREARGAFEQEVLPFAKTLIYSLFKAKLVSAKERHDTATMAERHEKAAASRCITTEFGENGMGYLHLYDSNEVIAAIKNRLTDMVITKSKDDTRTLSQRRTDAASEILLKGDLCSAVDADSADPFGIGADGKRLGHGITAQVHVEIPLLTLLGQQSEPATLEGIMPIDPVTARKLVADAPGLYRLLTDPVTGSIVAFDDRFRYLPRSLRRAVRLVDGHCTAPWCDATEKESDGHHPDEWANSHDTSLDNSALVCQPDHRLVHNTRWSMVKLKNGDKQWISPCGRIRRVPPERRLSPAFVEALHDNPTESAPAASVDSGSESWFTAEGPEQMPF